jgi:hypothetical protein
MPGLNSGIYRPNGTEDEKLVKLTAAQEFIRNKEADAILFVDVLG